MRSPREDAEVYCMNKLKNQDITQKEINEIFKLSDEYDLLEVRANTYCKLGEIYFKEREFEVASYNYTQARDIYRSINKNKDLGYVYWRMGVCKAKVLKCDVAIEYYQLSRYYCSIYSDDKTEKMCLYSLANSYEKLNKIDLALETIEIYLSICNEEDYRIYIQAKGIQANCYEAKGDFDRAIDIYKSTLEKISDSDNLLIGYFYNNLGLNYCHKNDFKESVRYFEMAEKFRREFDKVNLSHTLIEKSNAFIKKEMYKEAIESIELGLQYAENYKDIEYLIQGNHMLIDIYEKIHKGENLKKIYMEIIELLKNNGNIDKLAKVYNDLALLYLRENKLELCEKYLLLSKKL